MTNRSLLHLLILPLALLASARQAEAQICGGTCAPLPPGAVSWWPLDGNANDILDGNSSVVAGAGGTFPGAMVCDGFQSSGLSGRVQVAPAANLDVGRFSFEGWVRPDALNSFNSVVVWKGNNAGQDLSTSFGIGLVGVNGGGPFPPGTLWGIISNGTSQRDAYALAPLPLGVFSHFAITADGTNFCIYIDGVQNACTLQAGVSPQTTSFPMVFAAVNNNFNQWNGVVDELTLYNRALTSAEVLSIYNAGSAGKCRCDGLALQLAAANMTIAAQQAQITGLQGQLATLSTDMATLDSFFQALFGQPGFHIPGATPIEKEHNVVIAILGLNRGRAQGLYVNLGGK